MDISSQLGNDIVDLDCDQNYHPRFPKRILSDIEWLVWKKDECKFALWSYWAAKEAAYKFIKQLTPETTFSPQEFEVDSCFGKVTYRSKVVPIKMTKTTTNIFCHTLSNSQQIHRVSLVSSLVKNESADSHSLAARQLARNILSRHFGGFKEIHFERSRRRPPKVFLDGKQWQGAMSFTHHGRFVAVSIGL